MNKLSFDKNWEDSVYLKGRQFNSYPYDILVSIVARNFFHLPLNERKKVKVLDLGCGAGNNTKFFAENGFSVFGIDGSKTIINTCKKRFNRWKLKGNFMQGDFLALPFKNSLFDLVVDRESLYANEILDIKEIINEVYKKLKPGGYFVSFMFNSFHSDKNYGTKIETNTYNKFLKGSFANTGKAHFTNTKEILQMFSKFKIENIARHSIYETYNRPKRFMEFDEYIIIAKKT
jgi:ubiquinone/menaquinone biosynthesis C-methylase UbiE